MSLDVTLVDDKNEEVFSANITHDLGKMASEAGIYTCLWRPDEIGATIASDITDQLARGFTYMCMNPTHYKTFDAPNGWGTYENFLPWVAKYLEACKNYPDASIEISR